MRADRTTILALAALLGASAIHADLLIRTDGKEELGKLLEIGAAGLRIRREGGEEVTLPATEFARVEFHRDLSGTTARSLADLADPLVDEVLGYVAGPEDYPSAGAVNLYLGHKVTFEADGSVRTTVRNIVRVLREH